MEKVNVEIHRVELDLEVDLRRMRLLAQLFDAQFSVAGDVVTTIIGTYPIFIARRHKLGKRVQARMATNLIIDFVGGSVPLAGDVFDVYFKSFLKNLALLEKAAEKKRAARYRHFVPRSPRP